jgi:hypothetical protein
MSALIASNLLVQQSANWLYGVLGNFCHLKLFKNNFVPTPASVLTDFAEATFPGYFEISLLGQFANPVLLTNGLCQIQMVSQSFTIGAPGLETIYGAYLEQFGQVLLSWNFDTPIDTSTPGAIPVGLLVQDWALAVAC